MIQIWQSNKIEKEINSTIQQTENYIQYYPFFLHVSWGSFHDELRSISRYLSTPKTTLTSHKLYQLLFVQHSSKPLLLYAILPSNWRSKNMPERHLILTQLEAKSGKIGYINPKTTRQSRTPDPDFVGSTTKSVASRRCVCLLPWERSLSVSAINAAPNLKHLSEFKLWLPWGWSHVCDSIEHHHNPLLRLDEQKIAKCSAPR